MRLHDFLDHHARQRPDALYAIEGARQLTYGQARQESNRLAHALIRAGVEIGDRIAVVAKNSIEFVLLYFAASKAGAILVPLNYRLPPAELAELVVDSRANAMFVGREFVPTLRELRPQLSSVRLFVTLDGHGSSPKEWADYREFVSDAASSQPQRSVAERDDLLLFYTSGTTGRPKGVLHTQRSMVKALLQMALELRGLPGDRWLVSLPVWHAAAVMYTAMQCAVSGGCMVVHREFSTSEMFRALAEESIAFVLTSSIIIREYLGLPASERQRFASLRSVIYGAAPMGTATLKRAMEVFGDKLFEVYGTTEANAITMLGPDDHRRALSDRPSLSASAGRAGLGTEIRIVDRDGRSLGPGARGEVVVTSPAPMRGYWQMPEATEEALRGGWMHTGDIGYVDEEGYLYVEGRVKDTITSGGAAIYPFELETVLRQHPAVADVAVIGVPDPSCGEAVKAIVVLRPGASASAEELGEFGADKLEPYKRFRSIDFVDALPKNAFGKVLKRNLRALYLSQSRHEHTAARR